MRSWIAFLFAFVASFPTSASALEGCVYRPDGSLVPNAKVTASILEQQSLATITATDGCFALTNLPDSLVALRVEAESLQPRTVLVLPDDPPLAITLSATASPFESQAAEATPAASITPQRDGGTISGVVRVGTKPLGGAPVYVQAITGSESTPLMRAITDAKGRFQLNGLPRRRYYVMVSNDYTATLRLANNAAEREPPVADLTRDRAATVDLAFVKTPLVIGRIADADGKPVRGAEVQIVLHGRSRFESYGGPTTRTTADGRYTIVPP
ncbi:MAG TPA: carboxypeptidase regulatory-like domain-containing protein, partial [Thermoanaerobaculia bacterium]